MLFRQQDELFSFMDYSYFWLVSPFVEAALMKYSSATA